MTWLALFDEFEWVKARKFSVVASIGQKAKTRKQRKDREQIEKQSFLTLGDLVKSSNKVFIKGSSLFISQQQTWCNNWKIRNVIEIKNNEIFRLFLVEKSWNQWFLSPKSFCIGRYGNRRSFQDLTTNLHWEEVATETVKHEIKTQDGGFLPALLAPLDTSVVQPVISMSGSGVRRARKGYGNKDT